MDYTLSPEADRDVEDIVRYTLKNWGEKQTALYLKDLQKQFQGVALSPHVGRARSDLRAGVFSCLYRQRIIFYRLRNNVPVILRVLRQSRDQVWEE